jgi:hypothetical protein
MGWSETCSLLGGLVGSLVVRDCWVPSMGNAGFQSVGMLFSHTMSRSARNFLECADSLGGTGI